MARERKIHMCRDAATGYRRCDSYTVGIEMCDATCCGVPMTDGTQVTHYDSEVTCERCGIEDEEEEV